MGELYKITHTSGRSYIGITSRTAVARFHNHKSVSKTGTGFYLSSALKKHGLDAFTVQTLAVSDDMEYLKDLEVKAIAAFNTLAPAGYNLSSGGEHPKMHAATRKKLSTAMTGKSLSEEHKRKISASVKSSAACVGARNKAHKALAGKPSNRRKDYAGLRSGLLVAVRFEALVGHSTKWLCRCDCGGERIVAIDLIKANVARSCGCLKRGVG